MIKGKKIQLKKFSEEPQTDYRKLEALNQSMLKIFDSDPVKFFDEFKLGRKRKRDTSSTALILGDMVDFYLLSCNGNENEFDSRIEEKFAFFNQPKGGGQAFSLADILYDETQACTDDDGRINCSFEARFQEAVRKAQASNMYKNKDIDKILVDFNNKALSYFQFRMENTGKTVIDISLINKGKIISKNLKNDPFTKYIFTRSDKYQYLPHFVILWKYFIDEKQFIECKSEVDILIVDESLKTISLIDLKTTYDNESFDYNYIKNGYYIQNAFYHKAVQYWAHENNMEDYTVNPMKFVVGDTSSNNRRPLVYETSMSDIEKGLYGFSLRGTYYRGVDNLIKDIAWAEKYNLWNCSKEAYDNNGQLKLNIKYE